MTVPPAAAVGFGRLIAHIEAVQSAGRNRTVMSGIDADLRDWGGFPAFCEQYLRIKPMVNQDTLVPLRLNWMQQRILDTEMGLRRDGRRPWIIVLKFRKGGVTTLEQALAYWQIWRVPHQDCVTIAHDDDTTALIFRMVGRFYDNQPGHRHRKTQARVSQIEFPDWDAIYTATTAGRGKVGRGSTFARLHLSEAAFYKNLRAVHTGVAESIGPESAYTIETTPNGQEGDGEAFWEFWKAAKAGQSLFTPMFFAWHDDPQNTLPIADADEYEAAIHGDAEVANLIQRFQLTPAQVWWWLQKRRALVADGRSSGAIHQEHPDDDDTCFLAATPGYYDPALCDAALAHPAVKPPNAVEQFMGGTLRIWEVPDKEHPASYIAGCDPSGGTGGDNAGIVCFNHDTGRQAFTWQSKRVPPDVLGAEVMPALGRRWADWRSGAPIYWVPEQNNHGHATCAGLLREAKYPKDRVYHQVDDSKVDDAGNVIIGNGRAGWNHTTTGHYDLTTGIGRMLREQNPLIRDTEVIASIRRVGNGRHGAEFTGRDLAVAAGLAQLGWHMAAPPTSFLYIGGRVESLTDDIPEAPETPDPLADPTWDPWRS